MPKQGDKLLDLVQFCFWVFFPPHVKQSDLVVNKTVSKLVLYLAAEIIYMDKLRIQK